MLFVLISLLHHALFVRGWKLFINGQFRKEYKGLIIVRLGKMGVYRPFAKPIGQYYN